ncbi:hypothetical protein ACOSQ2_015741 [Xanthoceras sorbifolium]|uniref:J domain-containing protein n=1 Tax=Xanthoceras sorbifolium TaxID=99658 RepID=A0ABQ8I6W4_9ROSI|nr:hypothetical protein JRO89_XS04G0244700 [Xanthoceras sorbifolium]
MDGNKDDALKCFKIGKEAFESGDRSRARKFLAKARRLDPSLPVDDIISSIATEPDSNTNGPSAQATSKPSDQSSVRRRAPTAGSSSSTSDAGAGASYTEEQIAIVRQVKRTKDYYEVLGVEKSCSMEDVKKAYRKLSLKVHPDKNKAPGAEEAFKTVSKAFQCLSNEDNRKKYDLTGSDEVVYQQRPNTRAAHSFNGFYDGDVDAEEIFRNFFFGGMPPATTQFRHFDFRTGMGQRTADHGSGGFHLRALIQLLPVILIILLQFLPSSEPIYALSRSYPYEHKFTTQRGVNYYVKSGRFEQDYPVNSRERVILERQVEKDYFSILAQNCRLEVQRQQWGFVRETPHCDLLRQYQAKEA